MMVHPQVLVVSVLPLTRVHPQVLVVPVLPLTRDHPQVLVVPKPEDEPKYLARGNTCTTKT
jgi:hypothetical protein